MFTSIDGASPGYTALTPHILAPRHISPPSILGKHLAANPKTRSGRPSSPEVLPRMDGRFPEYTAKTPSTLRWALIS